MQTSNTPVIMNYSILANIYQLLMKPDLALDSDTYDYVSNSL